MVPPATPILRFIARNAKGARASGDNVAMAPTTWANVGDAPVGLCSNQPIVNIDSTAPGIPEYSTGRE